MRGTFQVISERLECYTGERGREEQTVLALLDISEIPLINTLDYALTKDEEARYAHGLKGRTVTIVVNDVRVGFGGRVRLVGSVESVR